MQKLSLFLLFALLFLGCVQKEEAKYCTVGIAGREKTLNLSAEIADTSAKRAEGLMHREFLCENCSMLFVFEEEGRHAMWMKNTLIPLDMVFISGEGRVVDVKADVPPCKTKICESYLPGEGAKYALEVNAGWSERNGITAGSFFYKGCKDYLQQ
ncbi:hypothetical protein COV61_01195 [Candidatus Micrarchaeota archaeon CG11_big_fil_rev_8_21_14_0_20_47_5]|nr:MAG: hypothetical protein AUJ17_03975 [Candidatus Micrarchaeota archaeon CG1_02_47_40]PIN84093.1 MAG: hypothetical protein COV61_01195 [Candidatus Micrarchaeota archaeon CG11_big_fil_rev_8_21_14_0_20_47_5]